MTAALRVSIETSDAVRRASASTTGRRGRSPPRPGPGRAPGRVDSPPMSSDVGALVTQRRPWAIAASRSRNCAAVGEAVRRDVDDPHEQRTAVRQPGRPARRCAKALDQAADSGVAAGCGRKLRGRNRWSAGCRRLRATRARPPHRPDVARQMAARSRPRSRSGPLRPTRGRAAGRRGAHPREPPGGADASAARSALCASEGLGRRRRARGHWPRGCDLALGSGLRGGLHAAAHRAVAARWLAPSPACRRPAPRRSATRAAAPWAWARRAGSRTPPRRSGSRARAGRSPGRSGAGRCRE